MLTATPLAPRERTTDPQRLEQRTQELGRRMFAEIRRASPRFYQSEWWEERMMQLLTTDEWFKVQAFRFVDVLPALTDDRDVARHLREYFVHPEFARNGGSAHNQFALGTRPGVAQRNGRADPAWQELEGAGDHPLARLASRWMDLQSLDSFKARTLSWAARKASVQMAQKFIAGTNPREAERAIRKLRDRRLAFSVDVLGEAAVSEKEARAYQRTYHELIESLSDDAERWPLDPLIDEAQGEPLPRVNVSVKLTSLFSQFDPIDPERTKAAVKDRLRPLLRLGMQRGAHIHIDMEHYDIKDLTLEIVKEIFTETEFRDYPHFGCVLQAYLRDGDRDARDLVDWAVRRGAPIWVRLVKGAYWDTETVIAQARRWPIPVWQQKWQSDACFERMTRTLLANHEHVHTAFGSHNVRSLCHALALKELWDIPDDAFELQMLYGMGDPLKRAAVAMNQRNRIYTPYGELLPGMAYLIRRLLENTANESFLRHTVDADTPVDKLLEDPEQIGRRTPPPGRLPEFRYELEELIMEPFENVPDTDFTIEENRRKMQAGLEHVRAEFGAEYPLVINGERKTTGQWYESTNPARPSEVVGRVAMAREQEAEQAVQAAADAFKSWRRAAPADRANVLFRVAEIMETRRYELAALEAFECGKPWREADADVSEAIDFCSFYAKEMLRLSENVRRRDVPGETNELFYAPRGVVAVIAPWNFPLAILTGMTAAAVVTGNGVVMKPAETSSVIGAKLMEMFTDAGLPDGVLNYLPGWGEEIGDHLVKHPTVSMIAFTGSRAVGTHIHKLCGEIHTDRPGLKKAITEMGGKNATIVDSDADLDEAVKGITYAAFGYAGQKCSASSRAIVLESVYDRFVERMIEAGRSLQVTPADDPGTYVPSVIDEEAYNRIREYIDIGRSEAKCVLEVDTGKIRSETNGGYFIGPTIFADVDPHARIAQEEIFGPVLAIIKARDMDHAIEIFNDVDYGLTGGIFSRSPANIERARVECECGNFYINRKISGALVDLQPFGGFKMSGGGTKAGGPDYLKEFCEPRCVTENTLRRGFAPSDEVLETIS